VLIIVAEVFADFFEDDTTAKRKTLVLIYISKIKVKDIRHVIQHASARDSLRELAYEWLVKPEHGIPDPRTGRV
jgi:hypothetical protein